MTNQFDNSSKIDGYTATMIINGCLHKKLFINKCLGQFTFEKLTAYGNIGQTYYLIVFSNILPSCEENVKLALQNEKIQQNSYFYSFPIEILNCNIGQVLLPYKTL